MTPDRLASLLQHLDRGLPGVEDPRRLLRALEEAADRRPEDRALAEAVLGAHGLATAGDGLPAVVAGVRREILVRWDAWTTTWDGPHLAAGTPARVRTLRPYAARDPVLRRALRREGRAAAEGLGDLPVVHEEGAAPALRVALPGTPLAPSAHADDRARPDLLVRLLATAVADLARWEAARLGVPALSAREWLDTHGGLRIVCLSPETPAEAGGHLARLATDLLSWWGDGPESPVDALLEGFSAFPPRSAADAAAQVTAALAQDLAATRHRLRRRHDALADADRRARLAGLVRRLGDAVPPPHGSGPVGVDLEGRVLVVSTRQGRVTWGPRDAPVEVRAPGGDLEVREGRRLLRAQAAAPPNERLAAEAGGQTRAADRICRWVAAALQLRTVRLLLDAG